MEFICITVKGFYVRGTTNMYGFPVLDARGHGPGDTTIFRRTELGGDEVTLALLDGRFVAAQADGAVVLGPERAESRLTEVRWPDDRYSLRSTAGLFLCAERAGGSDVVADRPEAGPWEKFFYEPPPPELLPQPTEPERGSATLGDLKLRRSAVAGLRPTDVADLGRSSRGRLEP